MAESSFSCALDALPLDKREQHFTNAKRLFGSLQDIQELRDGYAFHLSDEADILLRAAEFVSLERLCCPFFEFKIKVEAESGEVWLSLTGREGVKPFIRAEIAEFVGLETLDEQDLKEKL